jgi:uncharacterized protein (TIGR03435 family)
MRRIGKALVLAMAVSGIVAVSVAQTAGKLKFEVVSIKKSDPNVRIRNAGGVRGDRLTMSRASLRVLLQNGYQAPDRTAQLQIIGAPNWIDSDFYDVQATANCSGGAVSRDQVQLMVQSMLEDRFQLKAHMETRELPIYNLVVAKDGPKLIASNDQTPTVLPAGLAPTQPCSAAGPPPPQPPPPGTPPPGANFVLPRGGMRILFNGAGFTLQAASVPLDNLVSTLQGTGIGIGRPIVNKTGLKGLFDFKLQFSAEGLSPLPTPGLGPPGAAAADPAPSLFTAIQDLGLRLESAKGPIEVLVIDSVQHPTEN